MDKVDRLGWAVGAAYTLYGLRIGLRANSAEVLARAATLLLPGAQPAADPMVNRLYSLLVPPPATRPGLRHFALLYADAARLVRDLDAEAPFAALARDLQSYVAEFAPEHLFVHAGVVGWRGQAILLPGRSLAGKSTLVAMLLQAGATYYSDEYAVLDAQGRVHPFARPLTIRAGAGLPVGALPSAAFGAPVGAVPLPVGRIVVTRYRQGARWRPRRMATGKALLALLANTVAARREPERALRTLRQTVAEAEAVVGVRGEAAPVVARLLV